MERPRIRVDRPSEGQCPLCWEAVASGGDEPLHECRSCSTRYHLACMVEMGGCATLGCQRKGWIPQTVDADLHRFLTPQRLGALRFQQRRTRAFTAALREARLTGEAIDHDHRDVYGGLLLVAGLVLTGWGLWLEIAQRGWFGVGLLPLVPGVAALACGLWLFQAHISAAQLDPASQERERAAQRAALWDEVGDQVRVELAEEAAREKEREHPE